MRAELTEPSLETTDFIVLLSLVCLSEQVCMCASVYVHVCMCVPPPVVAVGQLWVSLFLGHCHVF